MDNLDDMDSIGDTSSASKESEVENVDAIKKYIEEQELLLMHSAPKDPVNNTKKENLIEGNQESTQKLCKVLEQLHSDDTQPQTPSSNDSLLDLENEEKLAKQAAENLLSLSQNCLKMQTALNEPRHTDKILHNNIHKQVFNPKEDIISERENVNLCEKIANNHLVIGNIKDQRESNIELNSINTSHKNLNNELQSNMDSQIKLEKVDNIDSIEKCTLLKSCAVSDLESKENNEYEYSDRPKLLHQLLTSNKSSISEINKSDEFKNIKTEPENKEHSEESLTIATSVLDMILHDTEVAIKKKKARVVPTKQYISPEKVHSSVSLDIGTKIEAKDFCGLWHPAQIIEVDYEELEVLVQYDIQQKMLNEWIKISSPRLRSLSGTVTKPMSPTHTPALENNIEPKVEDKVKLTFAVGERCLARWRDNRRFIATIQKDFENGNYEVMFDDGFIWKCPLSRLYKLKESSGKHEYPRFGSGPSPAAAPPAAPPAAGALARLPAFHTHLFDPTRDYLGSKSERREMKRKLNIKEIFNIGQKRKKLHTVDKGPKTAPIHIKEEIKCETTTDLPAPETASMTLPPNRGSNSTLPLKRNVKRKPPVKKIPPVRKKIKLKPSMNIPLKVAKGIPEAVASIIGTVCKPEPEIEVKMEPPDTESKDSNANDIKPDEHSKIELTKSPHVGAMESKPLEERDTIDAIKQEIKLEKFEMQDGVRHEEVIGKIKQVITKLEDGINEHEKNDEKPVEAKAATLSEAVVLDEVQPLVKLTATGDKEKSKVKKSSKVKKGKKLRLMQEKKVKKQVAQVKCQLEDMKKQVEKMRQEIMLKTEELANSRRGGPVAAPESCLLPGEWCCRWVDGQPVGPVSEVQCDGAVAAGSAAPLPRRSVQVEDKRLPPGWTKHMVRRSLGNSAGKWDVVLVSPENRRLHTKNDMRVFLENNADPSLKAFEAALMDFGIHLKLSRRMGWVSSAAEGAPPPPPAAELAHSSPLLKRSKLSLEKNRDKSAPRNKRKIIKIKPLRPPSASIAANVEQTSSEATLCSDPCAPDEATLDGASIKDGYVYVGSLKVQVIETLLRCPAEGCFKNFRNTMLLKMHIKHYHRELRKTMGNTPKVLDLAYARTRPTEAEIKRLKCEAQQRIIKVKLPRLHKRAGEPKEQTPAESKDVQVAEPTPEPRSPPAPALGDGPKPHDSPKLRNALVNKPTKRPRVLLPVRTKEPEPPVNEATVAADTPIKIEHDEVEETIQPKNEIPDCGTLDFETAISTHTVTKLVNGDAKVKSEKKRKTFASIPKLVSEDEEWGTGSDPETRSSYPSCGTPDSKLMEDAARASSPSNDERKELNNLYMYTENGERIKLVRMKREEIINCHCGFREEDGLMVQCELCLCWQHAMCHNIQREAEVPEKYTCSICLNPRRGRRRQRFTHDQDRLYEGLLPGPGGGGGRACPVLRRAHELSGNLLRIEDALHAVRVNTRVATTRNHPKLYLWARDWESLELSFAQEKFNSEYSNLNVIINNLGKENLPIKQEELKEALDIKSPPSREPEEKHTPKKENHIGPQALLSTILSSPAGASLDLPISESELEKLAKSVQVHEGGVARLCGGAPRAAPPPQPEAAIENGACRARLLRHLQRCHVLLDQRLDSIEAQVAELESQDATLEGDETADFYPRTKQTMQMVSRDLDTMEELGIVT